MENVSELERQMAMLEGIVDLDSAEATNNPTPQTTERVVETAETLRGEVPFGSVTEPTQGQTVVTNPMNGVNMIDPATQQAAAQVVQQTTTNPMNGVNMAQQMPVYNQNIPTSGYVQQMPMQQVEPSHTHTLGQQPNTNIMEAKPVYVDINKSMYTTQTDFFRLKSDERSRIQIVSIKPGDIMMARTHYLNGLGYFNCLSEYSDDSVFNIVRRAACCTERDENDPTKFKRAAQKYLVPIIEYPVSRKDGKTLVAGDKPKLKIFNMNRTEYLDLINILKDYATVGDDIYSADLTSFDLSVSVDTTKKYPVKKFGAMPSIRNQFAGQVEEAAANLTEEYKATAWKEAFKNVSESQVYNKLVEIEREKKAASQLAAQQVPGAGSVNFNI